MKKEFNLFPYEIQDVFSIQEAKQKYGWGITSFNLPAAWEKTKGENIKIAVLDTGCDLSHPDLISNLLPGKNFIDKNKEPWDDNNHGTHVCGIIAAENNDVGVVGVAPHCKIVPVKVLDKHGSGDTETVCKGIYWSVDVAKVDFICMSLGCPEPIVEVENAIKYALSKKIICFVAAGNSGLTKRIFYPANYSETISVGSIDEDLKRSKFSNTGDGLDFLAPGSKILSTVPKNWYAVMSGTSMATPFVAGIAALYLSYVKKNDIKIKLETSQDYINLFKNYTIINGGKDYCELPKKNNRFYEGFGILDPKKIFDSLKSIFFELFF